MTTTVSKQQPCATDDLGHIRRERDFYRCLLDLGARKELEPLLEEALALIVDFTGCDRGYLCINDTDSDTDQEQERWRTARGCTEADVEEISRSISHGIIGSALASGEIVETQSALRDPRWQDRRSVQAFKINAVLCAPVGSSPPLGAVYLQGRRNPGGFTREDRERVEFFAKILSPLAERLIEKLRNQRQEDHTSEVRQRFSCPGLLGRSKALAEALCNAALAAPLDITVLITGPSGTGKTALARAIAHNSPRSGGPFVELNCSAIPPNLVESELFGSCQGAHSTAYVEIPGKVRSADGGTLFLDEVGELSPAVQVKLLQLLQDKRYFPLGSNQPVQANVRIIAATNADLQGMVKAGTFREDLYHRLQILPVRMPTLAERREDIPLLAGDFCTKTCTKHGLAALRLSYRANFMCQEASWPGNVRELEHTIAAAAIRAHGESSDTILPRHLFPEPGENTGGTNRTPPTFQEATRRFQKQLLRDALTDANWNIAKTASRLDIARSHMYNLISAHDLDLERPKTGRKGGPKTRGA